MEFSISRFDPECDERPLMQEHDLDLVASGRMLLDVLLRLKAQDNTLSSLPKAPRPRWCRTAFLKATGQATPSLPSA